MSPSIDAGPLLPPEAVTAPVVGDDVEVGDVRDEPRRTNFAALESAVHDRHRRQAPAKRPRPSLTKQTQSTATKPCVGLDERVHVQGAESNAATTRGELARADERVDERGPVPRTIPADTVGDRRGRRTRRSSPRRRRWRNGASRPLTRRSTSTKTPPRPNATHRSELGVPVRPDEDLAVPRQSCGCTTTVAAARRPRRCVAAQYTASGRGRGGHADRAPRRARCGARRRPSFTTSGPASDVDGGRRRGGRPRRGDRGCPARASSAIESAKVSIAPRRSSTSSPAGRSTAGAESRPLTAASPRRRMNLGHRLQAAQGAPQPVADRDAVVAPVLLHPRARPGRRGARARTACPRPAAAAAKQSLNRRFRVSHGANWLRKISASSSASAGVRRHDLLPDVEVAEDHPGRIERVRAQAGSG